MKWLYYSGASFTVSINPLHWAWLPRAGREPNEWAGPVERTYYVKWLFLTARIWIDDGSW